jgi:hypothetical protein
MFVLLLQFDVFVCALWPLAVGTGLLMGIHVIPLLVNYHVLSGMRTVGPKSIKLGLLSTGYVLLYVMVKELGLLSLISWISKGRLMVWIQVMIILFGHFPLITSETTQAGGNVTELYMKYEGYWDITNIETVFLHRELCTSYGLFWLTTLCFAQLNRLIWKLSSSKWQAITMWKVQLASSKQCPNNSNESDGEFPQ